MRRNLLIIISIALCASVGRAYEDTDGYYKSLTGKSESALKTALYTLINPHTQVSSYQNLPSYFKKTDVRPNTNYWWDMYSDMRVETSITFGTYMNREHSLPKSWWGGNTDIPAYVDLYHLYPGEAAANRAKSNYPLGEIAAGTTAYFNNGVSAVGTGVNSGGAKYVFEPANEYKGDFARTYFYMVTAYQNMNWVTTWQVKNGTYPSLQDWAIDLLLKWHRADPVSQKELDRNEQVNIVQGNRNPFIDDPELAEYIWGNKKGQAYPGMGSGSSVSGPAVLITPPKGMSLDFDQVAVNHTVTAQLQLRSENCTGSFEISMTGLNKSYFTISNTLVATSQTNTASGTWVTVTYAPRSIGSHTAALTIQDGGLAGTRTVKLIGNCVAEPNLSTLTATAATDVTASTYTANWEAAPVDEAVGYYIVTVKRYGKSGTVTTTEHVAENNFLEMDGLDEGEYDTYAVQSYSLGVRSPMSNYVTVQPQAGVDCVTADEVDPLLVESYPGLIRLRCSNPHTGVRIYDVAGRIYRTITEIADYYELTLTPGVYFITTDQHPRPLRAIAR
ncbi:MAG: endonuclease [Paramuribaculum sp.]|nr:endonuclease [Paramuribaculum sp.]